MSLYLDTSALLKRYIDEPGSESCTAYLLADPRWFTARHTRVEVRRNLARLLSGDALEGARDAFEDDWARTFVVELDESTCEAAVTIAEMTGARTLDALHIAAAQRIAGPGLTFVTYDARQAQAARSLLLTVIGA